MVSPKKKGKEIYWEDKLILLQNLPTAFALLEKNRVIYSNPAFRKLVGKSETTQELFTVDEFIVKRFYPGYSSLIFKITEEDNETARKELKIVNYAGLEQWVEIQVSKCDGLDSDIYIMLLHDISKLKNRIDKQFKSVKHLHSILDQTAKLIITIDIDGTIRSCNQAFLKFSGLQQEEIEANNIYKLFEIVNLDEFESKMQLLNERVIPKFNFELDFIDEEEKKLSLSCEFSLSTDDSTNTPFLVVLLEDVTELKFLYEIKRIRNEIEEHRLLLTESKVKSLTQSINELTESRKDLKRELNTRQNFWYRLINVNPNLIFIIDHNDQYQLVNKTFTKILGKKVKDVIGKTNTDLGIKRISSQILVRDMPSFKHTEQDSILIEETIELPNGEIHHYLTSKVIVTKEEFQVDGNLHIATDITELKNTQLALSEQLSVEQAFQESIPAYVFRKDRNNVYVQANPAFLAFNGLKYEELIGKTDHDFYPKEQADWFVASDNEVMASKQPSFNITRKEVTAEGKERWVSTNKAPYFHANGDVIGIIGLAFDITEKKERDDKLQHRYQIEKLILEISTRFINLDFNQIDNEINYALAEVAGLLGINYALIIYSDDSRQRVTRTHSWCDQSIKHLLPKTENLPINEAPYFYKKMIQKETIVFNSFKDIPKEASFEQLMLKKSDIQSCVIVPLVYENETKGSICFCSVGKPRVWTEDDLLLSRMLSDIAVSALERKRNTLHIYKANQFIQSSVEANPIAIISIDLEGQVTFATGKLLNRLGLKNDELIHSNIRSVLKIEDEFDSIMDLVIIKNRVSFEINLQDHFIEVQIVPLKIVHYITGYIITLIDITDIKQSQKKIENQNLQLLAIFNQTDNLIFVTEPKTKKIIFANKRFHEYYGDDCIDQVCHFVVQSSNQECGYCKIENLQLSHGKSNTRVVIDKNNRIFNSVTQMITWIDDREVLYHTAIDITESNYLRELTEIQNEAHIALSQSNNINDTIQISLEAIMKITGFESGGVYLTHPRVNNFYLVYHQGCSQEFIDAISNFTNVDQYRDAITKLGFIYGSIEQFKDKCPPVLIKEKIKSICHLPIIYQEKLYAIFTFASKKEIDIKQEAIDAVKVMGSRLSRLIHRFKLEDECDVFENSINCIPEMVLIFDDLGIMVFANSEFIHKSGYQPTDIIGRKIMDFQTEKHSKSFYKSIWKTLRAGQIWNGEITVKYKDNSLHKMISQVTPIQSENHVLKYCISRSKEIK